ncbi:Gypsy retrotransposon integrase-like protein 1 [Paramarasmius palmivorus]|uniref:Gypsy retrotransposon integrase-like protein 1 n=1 Tax=Paramarasmius palmivorus TaxID=297713 RepID=A0AAW0DQB5_9AGAR
MHSQRAHKGQSLIFLCGKPFFSSISQRRGPKSPYVEKLEKRIESLETVIRKLSPQFSFEDVGKQDRNSKSPSPVLSNIGACPLQTLNEHSYDTEGVCDDEEDDLGHLELAHKMKNLVFGTQVSNLEFWGPSSGFKMLESAHTTKTECTGTESLTEEHYKRRKYWDHNPWELEYIRDERPSYVYPDDDLLTSLIDLYFSHVNCYLPTLHAPTFKKRIAEGVHLRDAQFGAVVLAACALGARYSNDPRVLIDSHKETSAGWQYFMQVKITNGNRMLVDVPTLYALQYCCLSILYMCGTSFPQSVWMLVGIGMRSAEELGLHRRKPEGIKLTAEYEQLKRAFWVLVVLDRLVSNFSGRPTAIREDEFDQELPVDCDDEYWGHPDPDVAFKQPPDNPSSISCFICYIKLTEILAFALVFLFPTKKSRLLLGLGGPGWQERITAELDSSLNNWINTVPEHWTILLTNIWSSKHAGVKIDLQREMADVMKIMNIMSKYDRRWVDAGRFKYVPRFLRMLFFALNHLPRDIMYELARGLPYFQETSNETAPRRTPTSITEIDQAYYGEEHTRETTTTSPGNPLYADPWQGTNLGHSSLLPLSSAELGSHPIGLEFPKLSRITPQRSPEIPPANLAFAALSPMTDPSIAAAYYNQSTFNKQNDGDYDMVLWMDTLEELPQPTMWTTTPSTLNYDDWGQFVGNHVHAMTS